MDHFKSGAVLLAAGNINWKNLCLLHQCGFCCELHKYTAIHKPSIYYLITGEGRHDKLATKGQQEEGDNVTALVGLQGG